MIFSSNKLRIPEIPLHEAALVGTPEDEVCMINGESGKKFTYQELGLLMEAVGSGLTRLGVKKGDVVGFYCPNSAEYVICVLGCLSIGAVMSGINPNYKSYELGHQLSDSKVKVLFTLGEYLPMVKTVLSNEEHDTCVQTLITVDTQVPDAVSLNDLLIDDRTAFPHGLTFNVYEDLAAILYSSGTTGMPKGVMLTHYNCVAIITAVRLSRYQGPGLAVPLIFMPLFHILGLLITMLTFACRGRAIILAGFKPDVFLSTIQQYKVTQLHLVPPVIHFLAKHPLVEKYDLSSVRYVMCGAAPLTLDIEKAFLERLNLEGIHQAYGMTEAIATYSPFGKFVPGASGKPVPNTSVKIVDITTRAELEEGQEGEVLVKGPSIMKGYLNNPKATRDTIIDGWLVTGDIGHSKEDGYLFISGRVKELIKHKAFQVAPAELEGLLLTHAGISDVAVIGIPDERDGELPRAFVVRAPDSKITEKEVCDFIEEHLTHHKWLSGGAQFVENIPKTASGKIIRREVRKLLQID